MTASSYLACCFLSAAACCTTWLDLRRYDCDAGCPFLIGCAFLRGVLRVRDDFFFGLVFARWRFEGGGLADDDDDGAAAAPVSARGETTFAHAFASRSFSACALCLFPCSSLNVLIFRFDVSERTDLLHLLLSRRSHGQKRQPDYI